MWEFLGGPVVRTQCFHGVGWGWGGLSSIPGWGTKIPQPTWHGQIEKKKKKLKKTPPSPLKKNKYKIFYAYFTLLNCLFYFISMFWNIVCIIIFS